jgi:hypothetical protein
METPSLQKFMSQDFLKSSQFLVRIPVVPFIGQGVFDMREFMTLCESVEFPGKTVQTIDYKIPGRNKIRVGYSREDNEITTTFVHNTSIPVYDFFNSWIETCFGGGPDGTPTTRNWYFDETVANIELLQFSDIPYGRNKIFGGLSSFLNSIDKVNAKLFESSKLFKAVDLGQTFVNRVNSLANTNEKRNVYYSVKLENAYPVNVTSMQSNWSDDGFHRVTVVWAYEHFKINDSRYNSAPSRSSIEESDLANTGDFAALGRIMGW